MNKGISSNSIKKIFSKHNFKILDIHTISNNNLNEMKSKIQNIKNIDKHIGSLRNEKLKGLKQIYSIELLFKGKEYRKFREFCNSKGKVEVSEINEELLIDFSNIYGIGKKKVYSVRERLKAIFKEKDGFSDLIINSLMNLIPI